MGPRDDDMTTQKTTPPAKKTPTTQKTTPPTKKTPAKKSAKPNRSALAQARAVVAKVLKEDDPTVVVDSSQLKKSRPHMTSNSVVLDHLIGGALNRHGIAPCPGWPRGMISNIFGPESSGKTTIALEAASATCAAGGLVCFIDWEHAISPSYAKDLGCPVDNPDRFYLVQPNTLEAGLSVLFACARAGIDLIILDSVGAGIPKEIVGKSIEEKGSMGRVGLIAAKWSIVLPQLAADISKSGSHIMGLSQLRKKINTSGFGGGDDTTHQGGECWKFYSAVRVKFQRVKSLKTKTYDALTHKNIDQYTSAVIKATIKKSKISQSQQHVAEFHITFGEGIDNLLDLMNIGIAHGILNKSGSHYSWERPNGVTLKRQGANAFKSLIQDTKGAQKELEKRVFKTLLSATGEALPENPEDEEVDFGFITE